MKNQSRTGYLLKNFTFGLAGQLLGYVLAFLYQTVFIYYLGKTYLGVAGLFSNILSILALAELGVGAAIGFSLYEPVSKGNKELIQAFMTFYAKAYRCIGCVVGMLGLSLIPFLDFFVAERPDIANFELIYLLYVINSAVSYFFVYKQSLLYADQKSYVITTYISIFTSLRTILQIVYIIVFRDFIGTLILQVLTTILCNIMISRQVDRQYPYLKEGKSELNGIEKKKIKKKISAMFYHTVGSAVVLGTDNLLLSKYVGLATVGIYSNYYLLMSVVQKIIAQFTNSVVSGIGNLVSLEGVKKAKSTFDTMNFINYWIASFCAVSFVTLLNPFITVWIGTEYLFDLNIVIAIVLSYYLSQMRQMVLSFRNALGLFQKDKHKPIAEASINLIVSIVLLKQYGAIGVFLGTIISTITTSMWIEPYVLFRYYFKEKLGVFWLKYLFRTAVTVGMIIIMNIIAGKVFKQDIISLCILFIYCAVIPNLLMIAIFYKTKEFKECSYRLKLILKR